MTTLKPKTSHSVKFSIPEHIRTNNPLFVKFFEYYYKWMEEQGQPLDMIQNMVEYNDVDKTTEFFADMIMRSLLRILPPSTTINKKTLVKNIKNFFISKGTEDSFKFMMSAIFDEVVEIKWARDTLFRASGNEFTRDCAVAIEADLEFENIEGCELIQLSPYANGTVESCVMTLVNGKYINWIKLNEKTVEGEFIQYKDVKILKSTIDRSFQEINDYYEFVQISDSTLVVRSPTNVHPSIDGLVIKQVGGNGYAEVVSLESLVFANDYYYTVNIKGKTGTWNTNDIYFIAESLLEYHYTKADYYYGTVSPCVEKIAIQDHGKNYTAGQQIEFVSGSGTNVAAEISDVSQGGLDQVKILSPGYGYTVGTEITAPDGVGFVAEVEAIDGIDADVQFTMEVEDFEFVGQSIGLEVGDKLTLSDGVGNPKFLITPTVVSNSGNITSYNILNRGEYTVCPDAWNNKLEMLDSVLLKDEGLDNLLTEGSDTISQEVSTASVNLKYRIKSSKVINPGHHYTKMVATTVDGFGESAELYFDIKDGVITSVPMNTNGSGYTKAYAIIQNGSGIGFVAQCSIVAGAVTSITILDGGFDYSPSDTVTIIGDGVGATTNSIVTKNGVVKTCTILNGGHDYPYDTAISFTTTEIGAVPCTLSPVINEGKIVKVNITSGGEGYTSENNTLTISCGTKSVLSTVFSGTGLKLLIDGGIDDGYSILTETNDIIIQDELISSNNGIVGVNITNFGHGYIDPTEIIPLTVDVVSVTGSGAIFVPVLENGRIIAVNIIRGGEGYLSTDAIVVNGGGGTGAVIEGTVFSGSYIQMAVVDGGSQYRYGTKAYILGDGRDADITINIDTGLKSVAVVNPGYSYLPNTTLTVLDPNPAATGAVVVPVIEDGKIVDVKLLNPGVYYTAPTIQINGVGYDGEIVARVERNIKDVTYNNFGRDYTHAYALMITDGQEGKIEVVVDNFGSLKEISATSGSGYTNVPTFSATDNSGYGAISKIKIKNNGYGFRKPSVLEIEDTTTSGGSYLVGFGADVGKITQINFKDFGADYVEVPRVSFPVSAYVSQNNIFTVGEKVRIKNYGYKDTSQQTYGLLTEDNDILELEQTAYNLIQEYDIVVSVGPEMTVNGFDFASNLMYFSNASTNLDLMTEDDNLFITENDFYIGHEESELISQGDIIVGQKTGAETTILEMYRGTGTAIQGGFGYNNRRFVNVVGLLNSLSSKLNNNYNIHDFSYTVKSGLSQKDYEFFLKKTVHPAGYSMFGEIEIRSTDPNRIEPHLPNQRISDMFTILMTLNALALGELGVTEWKSFRWIDENKFKIDAWDYGYLFTESSSPGVFDPLDDASGEDMLITESGETLIGDGLFTYYPGHDITFYLNNNFKEFDPNDSLYNYDGTIMDFSNEIDIIQQ